MRHADLENLQKTVGNTVKKSPIAEQVNDFIVGVDDFSDADEFIRVLIYLKDLSKLSEEEADVITSDVENAVSRLDDRFPSVRFSER